MGETRTIDHQTLSLDAYRGFIEDRLPVGAVHPATMSLLDSRPTVGETVPILGDLANEFDFTQRPNPPLIVDRGRKPLAG